MDEEKSVDAPVRFFAICFGDYEGYWETFVFAMSAEEALSSYIRSVKRSPDSVFYYPRKEKVDVRKAELNKFGVLVSTEFVIENREIECQ